MILVMMMIMMLRMTIINDDDFSDDVNQTTDSFHSVSAAVPLKKPLTTSITSLSIKRHHRHRHHRHHHHHKSGLPWSWSLIIMIWTYPHLSKQGWKFVKPSGRDEFWISSRLCGIITIVTIITLLVIMMVVVAMTTIIMVMMMVFKIRTGLYIPFMSTMMMMMSMAPISKTVFLKPAQRAAVSERIIWRKGFVCKGYGANMLAVGC